MTSRSHTKSQGAQPGNLNALKHGLYSQRIRGIEGSALDETLKQGIAGEIAATRLAIRRLFYRVEIGDDPIEATSHLRMLDLFTGRLAWLLRIHTILSVDPAEKTRQAIIKALSEVSEEVRPDTEG